MQRSSNNSQRPRVIAHRGMRNIAPENSISAFELALEMGCDGIEFDVTLTSDSIPIVIHQESLEPSRSGKSLVPAPILGTRLWTDKWSLSQISELDAGSWYGGEFAETKIPTLENVLALNWGNCTAFMEIKDPNWWSGESKSSWTTKILSAVKPKLKSFPKTSSIYFLSFSPSLLEECRVRFPDAPRALNAWPLPFVDHHWLASAAKQSDCEIIQYADVMLLQDPSLVAHTHNLGKKCYVFETTPEGVSRHAKDWTAESRYSTWDKLLEMGIDAITCDFADRFKEYLS